MPRPRVAVCSVALASLALLTACAGRNASPVAAAAPATMESPEIGHRVSLEPAPFAPPGAWRQYADPAEAGFSQEGLEAARRMADEQRSAAVFAVYRGRVIAAWGDVERELQLHSVRKSLVSGLYGTAFVRREIDPEATLAELEIDDTTALSDEERTARVTDLLAARSGVYLGAAYAPEDQDRNRPARGSHPPGSRWFYNNWDFNVAEVIYEQAVGEDLFESFARRIAEPLGMEDWAPEDGLRIYAPSKSRHPAHTFRMSARDLARFGQLYLQEGRWGEDQVLPAEWVRDSTLPRSNFGDGRGYAYMWWTYGPGALGEDYPLLNRQRIYTGQGTGGQLVAVIADLDLVVVHRADTDHDVSVDGQQVWRILESIAAAMDGTPAAADPRLVSVAPVPFESQLPPYVEPPTVPISPGTLADFYGRYRLFPGVVVRVFEWQDRPFVFMPGEGEAELFSIAPDTFTVRVKSEVKIRFTRDEGGDVQGIVANIGSKTYQAKKIIE